VDLLGKETDDTQNLLILYFLLTDRMDVGYIRRLEGENGLFKRRGFWQVERVGLLGERERDKIE